MDLWPDPSRDYEKLKEIADSPAGKELIGMFLQQNSGLVERSGRPPTPADVELLRKNVAAFLSTEEAQKLLKQLGGNYGR